MLKTISHDEFTFFKKILKNYYFYIINNFDTLICKIYGLHKMKLHLNKNKKKPTKLYFVIIGNLFCTKNTIQIKYDLKGSTYGRETKMPSGK